MSRVDWHRRQASGQRATPRAGHLARRLRPDLRAARTVAALVLALASLALCVSAAADPPPYSIPGSLPAPRTAPPVDPAAPYTPVVLSLIAQLEPSNPPTRAELSNADLILHDGPNSSCHNVGPVSAPINTTPKIMPICWTDAQGVLNTSGPQNRGTTAPMTLMGLGATFDRDLANAWGQVEGTESREFMVTGLFGPQTDLDRLPNWSRNLTTTGEDAYLSHELVAAQIHGIQGVGTMSQMKHYAVYNGQNQNVNTDVQDQALHELWLTPYEGGFVDARASAGMCSYQIFRDVTSSGAGTPVGLGGRISSLTPKTSPFAKAGENPQTWPLNESHFSCEQPLILSYVLRDMWKSVAFIGSDYPATHSTSSILQGEDQEMPTTNGFLSNNTTLTAGQQTDASGSTCANASGQLVDCSTAGAVHVGGYPGPGCPTYGCPLVDAVVNGSLPLSVFNQSLARILYQEERFGMLGCDNATATCANPGGVAGDRSGLAPLPSGSTSGPAQIGTKYGDAAIVERYSEEGATLLKNDDGALPIKSSDLDGGIFVTGANANHTVADPTNEASLGFVGRDAINPLQQLKDLSGRPGAFTFVPANDPTGQPVPTSVLSTDTSGNTFGGLNLSVNGGAPTKDANAIDHTKVNGNQLAPATYTWSGYLYVPTADTYTFALQQSPSLPTTLSCPQTGENGTPPAEPDQPPLTNCSAFTAANAAQTNTPPDAVTFSLDGTQLNLNATTPVVYGATTPSSPTNAGYTEQGLISRTCATGTAATEPGTTNCGAAQTSLTPGYHQIQITVDNATNCLATPPAAAAGTTPAVAAVPAPCGPASFRFAYSRANGDIVDAANAAKGKKLAIVFLNDGVGATSTIPNPYGATPATISAPISLSPASTSLVNAVADANPNTVVVLNTANPVLLPWASKVKSVLEMWFAGQEGGTSTARILLGFANPSGHTSLTWPANATDTIWAYNETKKLYPGEPSGPVGAFPNVHLERLNYDYSGGPIPSCVNTAVSATSCTNETEGVFTGYRYFDQEGITPLFAFGHGLSYTSFAYSNLGVFRDGNGLKVGFRVTNTGTRAGAEAPQVYLGRPDTVPAGVQMAPQALAAFTRVELDPGQSKDVTLTVDQRALSYWSEATQSWVLDTDARPLYVGSSSRDIRLQVANVFAPAPATTPPVTVPAATTPTVTTTTTTTTTTTVPVPVPAAPPAKVNKRPTITFLSLKMSGKRVVVGFRACDDSGGKMKITERSSMKHKQGDKRTFAISGHGCGNYTRSWKLIDRLQSPGMLVVRLTAQDRLHKSSTTVTRTVRIR